MDKLERYRAFNHTVVVGVCDIAEQSACLQEELTCWRNAFFDAEREQYLLPKIGRSRQRRHTVG